MTKPVAIDLFAGCGGLTLGLKRAGFRVAAAVENDSVVATTYRANHPGITLVQEDVRRLTGPALLRAAAISEARLDLLAGCPPCQGFSTLRHLNGGRTVRESNTALVSQFLRLVRSTRPRAVMLENVPWILRTKQFDEFRDGLVALGYSVIFDVMDARDFAVPQRRKRAILMAVEAGTVQFASPARRRLSVRDAIGDLTSPEQSHDRLHNRPQRRSERVRDLIKCIPRDGGSRTDLPESMQLECHLKCNGFKDVYGRMAWDDPAPTITGGCFNPSKGRFLHPTDDRAISLREAAILQGFPKSYRFPLDAGVQAVALMIGNALPPEFVRRHAAQLRDALDSSPRRRAR